MPPSAAKTSYHHGDLREALVAAAERLMSDKASWTFTLREVARAAGVSHNAPYNHFPDRRALLAAVAARGFDDLTSALIDALAGLEAADAASRILAAARAYVAFAMARPSTYRLMFSADLAGHGDEGLKAAGARAFAVLSDLIADGVSKGLVRTDPEGTHALAAWSLVHGLGMLALDGMVAVPSGDPTLAGLTDAVAATLVAGLAR